MGEEPVYSEKEIKTNKRATLQNLGTIQGSDTEQKEIGQQTGQEEYGQSNILSYWLRIYQLTSASWDYPVPAILQ